MAEEKFLQLNGKTFELQRLPTRPHELLRAWDAADEYLLSTFTQHINPPLDKHVLLFNDSFGALAVGLQVWQCTAISDSYLSQQATRLNLRLNQMPLNTVTLLNSLELPDTPLDFVLIKVPKTLAYLEDFLLKIQPYLKSDTQIICAGMIKNLPVGVWKLLERLIGKTTTSLAYKKARLIVAMPDTSRIIPENPYPIYYRLENTRYEICNHANVFSRDSLDIGTRFLLAHLPTLPDAQHIVDLGCGNGVVGLRLAENHPCATVHFVDESFMAIASARANFQQLHAVSNAQFYVGDSLTEFATASMDLIVCNPPFHQQQTIGDQLAWRMFSDAKRVLKTGGQFWVIGNRHLAYQIGLKKLFKKVNLIAKNAKFEIFQIIAG